MDNGRYQEDVRATKCVEPPDELMSMLRQYRATKQRFDQACLSAQSASQERENAMAELEKLSAEVTAAVKHGLYDITNPKSAEAPKVIAGQQNRSY